ncbi:MAG: trigger factor [Actinobacteria bacterium]|nr:trigger factor [Actinomycetota bacterium]
MSLLSKLRRKNQDASSSGKGVGSGSRSEGVTSTVESLDGDQVRLTVTVSEAEFETAVDRAFRGLAQEIRLPGFRPGKAPRQLLEARLGTSAGRHEAIQEAVPGYYSKALIEHAVDAIDSPSLEITAGEEAGDLVFDATVPVRPRVSVSGYASLCVEVPAPSASEADITSQIDALREQHGTLEVVERAAGDGDRVTIDIEGSHEGEPVEGLTATDYLYEVGTGAVVDEIDENLRGASAGDTMEFNAEHPQEEGSLQLRIVLKEVQALVLPDADDSFASDSSEFDTIAELTEDLRSRITSMKQAQAVGMARENIARAVAELVTVEIPAVLVESAIDDRIRDMAMRMAQQGIDFARWIEATGQDTGTMREGFRTEAGMAARADLALRSVAYAEGIRPDDADVESHLGLMAVQAGQPDTDLDELRDRMAGNGHLLELLADLSKQAAMDWLFERVEFVDEDGNAIERDDLRPSEPEIVLPDMEALTDSGADPQADGEVEPEAGTDPDSDADRDIHSETDQEQETSA